MAEVESKPRGAPQMQRGGWLDVLRFAAASLIILYHFHEAGPINLETVHPVFSRGFLLTNFFLIDSGYVLARIYARRIGTRMTHGEFFRKRFLRVVPAHLVMISLLATMVLLAGAMGVTPSHPEWFDWKQFPAQFFLVQSFGVPGGLGWNAPAWSISALLGCYFAFPFMVKMFWRVSPWTALALGVGLYLAANALTHQFLNLPVYWMPMKYGVIRGLALFMLGVLLARFSDGVHIPKPIAVILGLGSLAALVAFEHFGPNGLAALTLMGVMIVAAGAIPVTRPSRFIELGALASFSIFITNEVVRIGYFGIAEQVTRRLGLGVGMQWALWVGGILSAFIFAFWFYKVFDAPTQAWFNRAKKPRTNLDLGGLKNPDPQAN